MFRFDQNCVDETEPKQEPITGTPQRSRSSAGKHNTEFKHTSCRGRDGNKALRRVREHYIFTRGQPAGEKVGRMELPRQRDRGSGQCGAPASPPVAVLRGGGGRGKGERHARAHAPRLFRDAAFAMITGVWMVGGDGRGGEEEPAGWWLPAVRARRTDPMTAAIYAPDLACLASKNVS